MSIFKTQLALKHPLHEFFKKSFCNHQDWMLSKIFREDLYSYHAHSGKSQKITVRALINSASSILQKHRCAPTSCGYKITSVPMQTLWDTAIKIFLQSAAFLMINMQMLEVSISKSNPECLSYSSKHFKETHCFSPTPKDRSLIYQDTVPPQFLTHI